MKRMRKTGKSAGGFVDEKSQTGFGVLENVTIASYVCDFGNMVVGNSRRKTFRLTNVGKVPVSFNFN